MGSLTPRPEWNVLDVGAGTGSLSVALKACYGGTYELADFVEPTETMRRALAAQGIDRFGRCDLSSHDPFATLAPGRDLVLFVEVLEHLLVNPVPLLRRMGALLRPGGYLLVSTPNQARLGNRLRLLRARPVREENAFPDDDAPTFGHVIEYTPDELTVFFRRAGLVPMPVQVVQNLPSRTPSGRQKFGTRRLNGGLARRWALGDEMILVGRRESGP